MSWLYTIVFAGLMFSSNGVNTHSANNDFQKADVPAVIQKMDENEKFDQTYPLTANGRVSISNVNGSIVIEAWDRNEIKLEYVKTADTRERLADVEIKIDSKPDSFTVETDYGSWKDKGKADRWNNGGKLQVEYRLMAPRGAVLNEVETVNGSVTVSNFVNVTRVSAVNGSVNAANLKGTARLSTVNGAVTADFDRLETGSKISLDTVNGSANLVIPSDSNATIKADSLNGNIANDFGLPVRKGKYIGRDMYGRLGAGEVQIRLNSVNGGLSVRRKNDGKSLSPATNLLQKEKDGEDWDNDNDVEDSVYKADKAAKVNKDIAKAVKDGTRITTKAVADAQVKINEIEPKIAKITADSIARAADAIEQSAQILSSADFKQKINDTIVKQKEVLASIADIGYLPRVERKSGSFPVKGAPKVTIDARGCDVKVSGWDKPEVQYVLTNFPGGRSNSPVDVTETHSDSDVNIKINKKGVPDRSGALSNGTNRAPARDRGLPENVDNIAIKDQSAVVKLKDGSTEKFDLGNTEERAAFENKYGARMRSDSRPALPGTPTIQWGIGDLNRMNRVHIEVFVPKKSNLKITTDGEIRIEGVSGDVDLSGNDESINVRDSDGTLRVSSSDGRIRVIGFKGEVVAESSNGMINLEGDFQKLKAHANDGPISLTLPDNTQADLEATCSEIHGEGINVSKVSGNEKLSKYRIGKGGASFQIETEGEIHVRGASSLKASY